MAHDHIRDRAAMEKHIQAGGSVLLPDGRNVSRVEDLPAEHDLAAGDRDRLQAEVNRLQKQHDDSKAALEKAQAAFKAADDAVSAAEKQKAHAAPKAAGKAADTGEKK